MNWPQAIEINRLALARIVAGLLALVGYPGVDKTLPQKVSLDIYQQIARALRPAESAVRRLIVIAARGLIVPPPQARPMPKETAARLRQKKPGTRPMAFRLFDTRKKFFGEDEPRKAKGASPRIWTIDVPDPRSPLFLSQLKASQPPPSEPNTSADLTRLGRRLLAVHKALANIPHQAKRMARWQARRASMKDPPFVHPMRPGPPPGNNKRSKDEIILILRECHALARYALTEHLPAHDTS